MNKAIFMGRLGGDPEVRVTQSGRTVARFSLAVNRPKRQDRENETDWMNIVAWGKLAEIAEKYLRKGAKILVTAAARTRSYDDNTGRKVFVTEFVAESIEFCESKAKTDDYTINADDITDDFTGFAEADEDAIANMPF